MPLFKRAQAAVDRGIATAEGEMREVSQSLQMVLGVATALIEDVADGVAIRVKTEKSLMEWLTEGGELGLHVAIDIAYDEPPQGWKVAKKADKTFVVRKAGGMYIHRLSRDGQQILAWCESPAQAAKFKSETRFKQFNIDGWECLTKKT